MTLAKRSLEYLRHQWNEITEVYLIGGAQLMEAEKLLEVYLVEEIVNELRESGHQFLHRDRHCNFTEVSVEKTWEHAMKKLYSGYERKAEIAKNKDPHFETIIFNEIMKTNPRQNQHSLNLLVSNIRERIEDEYICRLKAEK